MTHDKPSAPSALLKLWNTLYPKPGGRWLFNRLLAWKVPYSASINADVLLLQAGHCQTRLPDRRKVRNHVDSIHAIALVNLGEMTSGLALLSGLQANARGIVVSITTDYFKKARGTLSAQCRCDIPRVSGDMDYRVTTDIHDRAGACVARTTTTWRLGLSD